MHREVQLCAGAEFQEAGQRNWSYLCLRVWPWNRHSRWKPLRNRAVGEFTAARQTWRAVCSWRKPTALDFQFAQSNESSFHLSELPFPHYKMD